MKINIEGKTEFDRFHNLVKKLVSVPHREIKSRLEAYEKEKKRRRRKKSKASASGRASSSSH